MDSRWLTASSSMPNSLSCSLKAGTTKDINTSAGSISAAKSRIPCLSSSWAFFSFRASWSCHEGRGAGSVTLPARSTVVNVFSERKGRRGAGTKYRTKTKSCQVLIDYSIHRACHILQAEQQTKSISKRMEVSARDGPRGDVENGRPGTVVGSLRKTPSKMRTVWYCHWRAEVRDRVYDGLAPADRNQQMKSNGVQRSLVGRSAISSSGGADRRLMQERGQPLSWHRLAQSWAAKSTRGVQYLFYLVYFYFSTTSFHLFAISIP